MSEHSGATVTMRLPSGAIGAGTVSLIAERRGSSVSICLCTDKPGESMSVMLGENDASALSSFISTSAPRKAPEVLGWLWRGVASHRLGGVPCYLGRAGRWHTQRARIEFFPSREEALRNRPLCAVRLVKVVRKKRAAR